MATFQSPQLAPDLLRKQFQLQNNQALAQQLMQSEQPQGQMVGNQFVAPSWTQQLAAALRPVVGQQIMNKMPDQMAELGQAQQNQQRQQFMSLYGGQPTQGAGQPAQGGGNPADMEREFMIAQLMGPDKYAAERMRWNAPTNEQKNLGFLPENARNAAILAPFVNEMGKDGVQNVLGPNGQVQAFPVPGYGDIQANNAGAVAGAEAGAKAPYQIVEVPDGQGGTVRMPLDQAASALRTQSPTGVQPGSPASLGTTPPKSVIEARELLSKVVGQADQMIASIDGILQHPGLSGAVGFQIGEAMIPGTPERDFVARSDQLQGQAFLQAFESLKGGGQITEVEGKAATNAIGRLSRAQSESGYKESLKELRGILEKARSRAYDKAGVPMPKVGAQATPAAVDGVPAPASEAEFSALPSGTVFKAPDGSIRRKP